MGNLAREGEFTGLDPDRSYLDWNATSPLRRAAKTAWLEAMEAGWANANSLHREGSGAAEILAAARGRMAESTGTSPGEWIFNSGATEGIHTALHGAVAAQPGKHRIVSSTGEHAATRAVLADLESKGCEVVRVPIDAGGAWDPQAVLKACEGAPTAIVSLIWANNETGAISDVRSLAAGLRQRRIALHLDAVQVPGRIPFDLADLPAGMVSISGHKFGAPKGIGALLVRKATPWKPWILGGEQERGRRSGTSQVASAAAMAIALQEAAADDLEGLRRMRDRWEERLLATVPGIAIVGRGSARLPNTSALVVDGVESAPLLLRLDDLGFAVSSGSACTSGRTDPSPVLLAAGLSPSQAHSTIRVSFGPATRTEELDRLVDRLAVEVPTLRGRAG